MERTNSLDLQVRSFEEKETMDTLKGANRGCRHDEEGGRGRLKRMIIKNTCYIEKEILVLFSFSSMKIDVQGLMCFFCLAYVNDRGS